MSKQKIFKRALITAGISIFLISHTSFASTSSNDDYSIEFNESELPQTQPASPPKVIPSQVVPPKVEPETRPPYTITATNDMFSFNIAQTIIDFGALSATNPVIRTSDISFSTPFYGAQILGYENHPLVNTEKIFIPDTTCDTGTCSQTIPSNWDNNLTYGFGFRCDSSSKEACGKDFSGQSNYKQLADTSAKESPQPIILNGQDKRTTSVKLTYKVNISGTQQVGGYSNSVTLIAIPNF